MEKFGIVGYGAYIPRYRVKIEDIGNAWLKNGEEVADALSITEKSVPGFDEDTATISVHAAKQALKSAGISGDKLGALYVGSESHPYVIKPTSATVAQAIGATPKITTVDMEFACKAGTAGMQICQSHVKSGFCEYAMAIGADTAQGRPADALEYTASAGGASFIFGKEPVAELEHSCSFTSDTPDFWRREGEKYPSHGGRFTGEPGYFKHVLGATNMMLEQTGYTINDFNEVVFHMPNVKFPLQAAKKMGIPAEKMKKGLVTKEIGNTYSGSSMLGLARILDTAKPGEKILMTSFGSGAGSDSFIFNVTDKIAKITKPTPVQSYIDHKHYIDYTTYLKFRKKNKDVTFMKVGIIGTGITNFGEHWDKGLKELATEAGIKAIEDSGIHGKEIEALYGGNMSAGRFAGQEHLGALIADQVGLNPIPATRVEAACASGGLAVREGYLSILSGEYDCVVVAGVEKMTDINSEEVATTLGAASDQQEEAFFGITFPGIYAMMARRHIHDYGTTEEQLAAVAVKNHKNGKLNPIAQYQNEITVEDVMESARVADPLKLLDCSPITDGAAAIVLASEKFIKEHAMDPVWITASAQASDTLALHHRAKLTELWATQVAAKKAYEKAGVTAADIDLAEVHDCFTIAEIMAYEDLGFAEKGKGGKAVESGAFDLNSGISVNTSGGLKACGHPVGATGVKQIIEVANQLEGNCGKRQVKDATIGLTHNVGGSGATSVIHILEK